MPARVKIVGWDLREIMPEYLISEALRRALAVRQPTAGLLVYSDRVSQYTATRFRDLLADHGAQQRMSQQGNCHDNAQAESFWSRLKTELLDGGSFPGLAEMRLEVAHYIAYYNDERRHSSLDYQSPILLRNPFSIHVSILSSLVRPPQSVHLVY
jgi:transposase InsO family protein